MLSLAFLTALTIGLPILQAFAETHTVHFDNRCGFGTPTLVNAETLQILSTGEDFTINGPLQIAVAYLQTGDCGLLGEGCTLIEITFANPTSPGLGSSADINLIPPQAFSVASGFEFINAECEGRGLDCTSSTCAAAVRSPEAPVVVCLAANASIAISFCD
ncbi:hypothetical protein D9619_002163 [Psilocybe cf. subviscida]|uniref:Glycopeptide n=1 Tax=Psilocybe cf. subviscida TaxID=2480587 RepID=A0A8H5F3G3_9AGAR|nr:hypothetical protein D9619_002163 [Psilocybe cf. subviscida]